MRRALLGLAALAACDPLAASSYVGEPMFTLTGTIVSPGKGNARVGGLALMWQDTGGAGGPGIASMAMPFAIESLSTFRAAVPLPPPDAALFAFDDSPVELAEAYVYVVEDPAAPRLLPRGLDRTHALVYATRDVADGTVAAAYLGGPVAAGYHLRRFELAAEPSPAQRTMIDRCVTSGHSQASCAARRGYQLAATTDSEALRIVVMP